MKDKPMLHLDLVPILNMCHYVHVNIPKSEIRSFLIPSIVGKGYLNSIAF